MFDPIGELPFIFMIALQLVLTVGVVRRPVLVHGQGRRRDLLPRRRLGALRRRVGPRRRAREDEGEPRLRRGPRSRSSNGAATCPVASCCTGLRAPARRSWPKRSRARPASRTCSSSPAPSSTCSSASACSRCARCSRSSGSWRFATAASSSSSTKPTRSATAAFRRAAPHRHRPRCLRTSATASTTCPTRRSRRCCSTQRAEEPDSGRGGIFRLFMPGMRGGGGGDISALQALLAQMSGLTKPRGFFNRYVRRLLGMQPKPPPKYRIFFIMASNMPDSLDAALLRPGRLDRKYKVGYPSKEGRKRTFEGYLSRVKHAAHRRRPRTAVASSRRTRPAHRSRTR